MFTRAGYATSSANVLGVWRSFHSPLKRLLISDIIIRTCEAMTGVLTILYVTNVAGFSIAQYGTLIAVQMVTSILVYIPAGKIADRIGRKPFVIATFLYFALFPIAIIFAANFIMIVLAFVIGGLREIGEPARKANGPHLYLRQGSSLDAEEFYTSYRRPQKSILPSSGKTSRKKAPE
jgi:hypothetical protein